MGQVSGGNGAAVVRAGVFIAQVDQFQRPAGVLALEGGLPDVPVDLEAGAAADIASDAHDAGVFLAGAGPESEEGGEGKGCEFGKRHGVKSSADGTSG